MRLAEFHALRRLAALAPVDARNIARDPLLRWMLLYPVLIGAAIRWLLPAVAAAVESMLNFDLMPYLPLIASTLLLLMPMFAGVVIGFLFLDQRDDRTLTAMQVTPLPISNYLAYRISVPMLLSLPLTLVLFGVSGLPRPSWGMLILTAMAAAPTAPLYALALATIARNKVQGFALMKANGIVLLPPAIAWFLDMPLQLLCGAVPTYWPMKMYWILLEGGEGALLFGVAGLVFQAFLLVFLLKRFRAVMTA